MSLQERKFEFIQSIIFIQAIGSLKIYQNVKKARHAWIYLIK